MTGFDPGAWMLSAMALAVTIMIAREALFRFELWRHRSRTQFELEALREAVDDPGALLHVDDELAALNAPLRFRFGSPVQRREAFDLLMGAVALVFLVSVIAFAFLRLP